MRSGVLSLSFLAGVTFTEEEEEEDELFLRFAGEGEDRLVTGDLDRLFLLTRSLE